ncbi:hypothetical protein FN846DRAFT_627949 [Sphaerosporella brunnea]|uniref:Major facilitator superfamily domain-containing protein n=1 Tax=Sphaerosporella brunnea TaxID=1250544 RepID=A0A5J5F096_9PEZI|nr:hypothetical protein FN846DRAFT_627949 [Sphaerosporella brunnea]
MAVPGGLMADVLRCLPCQLPPKKCLPWSMFAFIGVLSVSSSMVIGPLATIFLRKTSTRTVMATGVVLETGALVAASFSKKIWHLFLTHGVFFGLEMGMLFTGNVSVVSQWFAKKRSGITTAGSGTVEPLYKNTPYKNNLCIRLRGPGPDGFVWEIRIFFMKNLYGILIKSAAEQPFFIVRPCAAASERSSSHLNTGHHSYAKPTSM